MSGVVELGWLLTPVTVKDRRDSERPEPSALRPHMEKRKNESTTQFRARLAWSCYWCGKRFPRPSDETARALAREALHRHEEAAPRGCKASPKQDETPDGDD